MSVWKTSLLLAALVALPGSLSAPLAQETPVDLDRMLSDSHQVVQQSGSAADPLGQALQASQVSAAAGTLPNGASSITEIFGDWTVNCTAQNNQKICATSQVQGDSQTGQQVFAVELYANASGGGTGVLILPFGLDVREPVTFALDETTLGTGAKFTTCMPAGCIVPVAFAPADFSALKAGTTLTVSAKSISGSGEWPKFSVSLSGFTAATDRVNQLGQ